MMMRNILAIVIQATLLVSTANAAEIYNKQSNKLDLYGKVNVRHFWGKSKDKDLGLGEGDKSHVLLGIKGESQISDQLTGFGRFEWEAKTNLSEVENKNTNHLAYAGLKIADFGSIDYGRNYGVLYDVNSWTDVLPLFGGDSMSKVDNYMTGRNHNLLTYRTTDFFSLINGLNFALQYQGKNTESNKSKLGLDKDNNSILDYSKNNGDGFGLAANYDIGNGITLGGAYTKSHQGQGDGVGIRVDTATSSTSTTTADSDSTSTAADNNQSKSILYRYRSGSDSDSRHRHIAEGWNAGIKYDANNLYLAAMYGKLRNMNLNNKFGVVGVEYDVKNIAHAHKTNNIELVAQYLFDEIGLKPSVAYVHSTGKGQMFSSSTNQNHKQDLKKYVSFGAFYYFNKYLTAVVDYKLNLVKAKSSDAKTRNMDLVGIGLNYQF